MLLRVEETIQQEVKAGGGGDAKDKAGGRRQEERRGEKETKEARTQSNRGENEAGVRRTCATTVKLSHFYPARGLPK